MLDLTVYHSIMMLFVSQSSTLIGKLQYVGGHTLNSLSLCTAPKWIKMFVLDEADEMLSRGFKDQIYEIFQKLSTDIQVSASDFFFFQLVV